MKNNIKGEHHHSYGKPRSEETKRKISETRKKNNIVYPKGKDHPFYGKHHSEESKKKASDSAIKLNLTGDRAYWYGKHPSKETREKLSLSKKGDKNSFYGKKHTKEAKKKNADAHKDKYPSLETRKKMSKSHKGLAAGDKNPNYGRPPANGGGTGWSGWYKGWHFRSVGELRYIIEEVESKNLCWKTAEVSSLKIPYLSPDGSNKMYYADFLVDNFKLVEVKNKFKQKDEIVIAKSKAAEDFCRNNGLIYEMVDSIPLSFEKLEKLISSGEVTLIEKWQKRFQTYLRKN